MFSRNQNADFLNYVAASYENGRWNRLSQCFLRAAEMGMKKVSLKHWCLADDKIVRAGFSKMQLHLFD